MVITNRWLATVVAAVVCASIASSARAQDKMTYYTVVHPKEFAINWLAFYTRAEELTAATRKALPHQLDIPYGNDPKQKLDVYQPTGRVTNAPVFVFLHGGGFREGDRAQYGYIAAPFAQRGIVTAVASYRLMPKFHYPDQPEDVRHMLAWVFRNISRFGGDPNRVYLGGHSAGSQLTALVALKTDWLAKLSLPSDFLKGAVMLSGISSATPNPEYVPDEQLRVEANPMLNVDNPPPNSVIAVGSVEENEPKGRLANSQAIAEKIRAKGAKVTLLIVEGRDHAGVVAALGEPDSPLVKAVLEMIEGPAAGHDQSPPRH